MTKFKIRIIDVIYGIALISADVFIFLIIALFLMGYDDNYDVSKGEYWSLASMNASEKILYICYISWIVLNIVGLFYLGYKVYKMIRKNDS